MTLGDDFVLTGPTERLSEFQTQHDRVEPNRSKTHQLQVNKEHQNIEQKVVLAKARNCISAPSKTCRRARDLGLEQGNSVPTQATHDVTEEEAEP